jgi:hypothetical protein
MQPSGEFAFEMTDYLMYIVVIIYTVVLTYGALMTLVF